jgi:putative FmdB family regulatory protein
MPIYEFFCSDCNTIFNFFSRTVNTSKKPICPKCKTRKLSRRLSMFAVTGRAKEEDGADELPFDEGKMGRAMEALAREADRIDENDPKQAADLMRKLTDMTGVEMGPQMQEALRRMEAGEDPEQVEAEMGDLLEEEEPFLLPGQKGRRPGRSAPAPPKKDDTLYEL